MEVEEQTRKNAESQEIIQIQQQKAQHEKCASEIREKRLDKLYQRGLRKLENPEYMSDDEEEEPSLPAGYKKIPEGMGNRRNKRNKKVQGNLIRNP